jgi:hypothetical protein
MPFRMGAARSDTPPEEINHLRGVRVARVESGRVIRAVAVVVIVALVVAAAAVAASAAHEHARASKLQQHGVPVTATVSGCTGISSGIAMAIEYWECRGTYQLDGHRYNEVIRGSRARLDPGQTVQAVAVPGEPQLLSTAAAAAHRHSPWPSYVTSIILGAVALILVGLLVRWSRRRPRPKTSD